MFNDLADRLLAGRGAAPLLLELGALGAQLLDQRALRAHRLGQARDEYLLLAQAAHRCATSGARMKKLLILEPIAHQLLVALFSGRDAPLAISQAQRTLVLVLAGQVMQWTQA